jgi:hypothetical protein
MKNLTFYLGFGTLLAHELDSMVNHEWRVIPIIRLLSDQMGMIVFIAAHIPIFALLVALVSNKNSKTRRITRIAIGLFLLFHGLLHIVFKNHPAYEFSNVFSHFLIFGGSTLGVIYLILEWHGSRTNTTF